MSAFGARKGPLAAVVLVDGPLATVQRRASQVAIVHKSLRPAGYVRETYRGRAPRPLDAARVAELKTFIERMRNAADVPGMSAVLFDTNATLIDEGFGVRERGRPEPVTADSLFMIASNALVASCTMPGCATQVPSCPSPASRSLSARTLANASSFARESSLTGICAAIPPIAKVFRR